MFGLEFKSGVYHLKKETLHAFRQALAKGTLVPLGFQASFGKMSLWLSLCSQEVNPVFLLPFRSIGLMGHKFFSAAPQGTAALPSQGPRCRVHCAKPLMLDSFPKAPPALVCTGQQYRSGCLLTNSQPQKASLKGLRTRLLVCVGRGYSPGHILRAATPPATTLV